MFTLRQHPFAEKLGPRLLGFDGVNKLGWNGRCRVLVLRLWRHIYGRLTVYGGFWGFVLSSVDDYATFGLIVGLRRLTGTPSRFGLEKSHEATLPLGK